MNLINRIFSLIILILIIINLTVCLIPIILLGIVKSIFPKTRKYISYAMDQIYSMAVSFDDLLLFFLMHNKITIQNEELIPAKEGKYIAISNHQSWADTFIIQSIFNKKIPPPKFLVKKEILYIPLANLVALFFEFPLLKRSSYKNKKLKQNTQFDSKAIEEFIASNKDLNTTFFLFPEGTRLTMEKQSKLKSPFKHLLPPKTAGLWALLNIKEQYSGIINVTINYQYKGKIFWGLLCGSLKNIKVQIDFQSKPQFNDYQNCKDWLVNEWKNKDKILIEL